MSTSCQQVRCIRNDYYVNEEKTIAFCPLPSGSFARRLLRMAGESFARPAGARFVVGPFYPHLGFVPPVNQALDDLLNRMLVPLLSGDKRGW